MQNGLVAWEEREGEEGEGGGEKENTVKKDPRRRYHFRQKDWLPGKKEKEEEKKEREREEGEGDITPGRKEWLAWREKKLRRKRHRKDKDPWI